MSAIEYTINIEQRIVKIAQLSSEKVLLLNGLNH